MMAAKGVWDRITSFYVRAFAAVQWLAFFFPGTLLVLVYPNLTYFAVLAQRGSEATSQFNDSVEKRRLSTVLCGAILIPLVYLFCFRYSFFNTGRSSRKSQKLGSSPDVVPDHLLQTSLDLGLTEDEVVARRQVYGRNELRTERVWSFFLLKMFLWPRGAANLNLAVAGGLATYFGDRLAATSALGILILNVGVYTYQTKQADNVVKSLALRDSVTADVLRDGQRKKINAKELVPGDVVYLEEGQTIPAECRIRSVDDRLKSDQSAITGESSPIDKFQGDLCYYTCGVLSGYAVGIVANTAPQTFVGRAANMVQGVAKPPSQGAVSTNQSIGIVFGGLALTFITVAKVSSRRSQSSWSYVELCVALAIAAHYSAISFKLQTIQSRGAASLSRQKAIPQARSSIDDFAGVDVLLVDKTGTLSQNKFQLAEPYCHLCTAKDLVTAAGLASAILSASDENFLDPIDKVCLESARRYEIDLHTYKLLDFKPFNADDKIMRSVVVSPTGQQMVCVKGAPRAVMAISGLDVNDYREHAAQFARQGLHCLGAARRVEGKDWELLGLLPLHDPPYDDASRTIECAAKLGVSTKMLTGDASAIAEEYAERIGLGHKTMNAEDVDFEVISKDQRRTQQFQETTTFAEVSPEHKENIVRLFQSRNSVAVTGDGVNNAAALRMADLGIAVEGASENAQAASDFVFLVPGISAIMMALQTCRQILEVLFTLLVYRTALAMHALAIVIWYYWTYDETFDLVLLLLIMHCSDLVDQSSFDVQQDIPFSKRPMKWRTRQFWTSTLPLVFILSVGAKVTIDACAMHNSHSMSDPSTKQQVVFLHAVLASSPISILMRSNCKVLAYPGRWRHAGYILLVNGAATATCLLGRIPQHRALDMQLSGVVWLCSLGTIAATVAYLSTMLPEKVSSRI